MNNIIISDAILENCKINTSCSLQNPFSYVSAEPMSTVLTTNNIFENSSVIVKAGLEKMSSDDLIAILCKALISKLDIKEDLETLLKLNGNNYFQVLKILLKE